MSSSVAVVFLLLITIICVSRDYVMNTILMVDATARPVFSRQRNVVGPLTTSFCHMKIIVVQQ